MIAADVVYLRPDTAEEAVEAWSRHAGARYLAGGTEITTAARRTAAYDLRACIDVKRIPELRRLEIADGVLRLGAALPLSVLTDADAFPLLAATCRGIADRTVRNRLSLGGNLAGTLPYREAALPLLLSPGELALSFSIPLAATRLPWRHRRATRTGPVDYPLVTTAMVRDGNALRLAVAGAHPYPVRSDAADAALSKEDPAAIPAVLSAFGPPRADSRASAEYRVHLLRHLIRTSLEELT